MSTKGIPVAAATAHEPQEVYLERWTLAIEISTDLRPKLLATQEESRRLTSEKEMMNASWATMTQIAAERKREIQDFDNMLGEMKNANAVQVKLLKQQVRELMVSNSAKQVDKRAQVLMGSRSAMLEYADSERELKADRRDLSVVLKELESGHEELVKVMRAESDKAVAKLRLHFEVQAKELASLYEVKMNQCREEMNANRERELGIIERRKATHVATMLASHEQAFSDIKAYFNEITHSNLDLIKVCGDIFFVCTCVPSLPHLLSPRPYSPFLQSLKEEFADLKKKEAGDDKLLQATTEANKRMSEPMRKAIEDVKRLREEREAYRADVAASLECKAATLVVRDRIDAMRWEHEILGQRYERLAGERDALAKKFREAIHEVQQKAGFKTLLLEQKLAVAAEEKERAKMVLEEVFSQANVAPPVNGGSETLRKGAEGLLQVGLRRSPAHHFLVYQLLSIVSSITHTDLTLAEGCTDNKSAG